MFDLTTEVVKGYTHGTQRLIDPAETFARAWQHAAVMGITRVANVTGLDRIGIPVVMVSRPNARSIAVSQGKGLTLAAAKAFGLMEAIEGYHAENILLPLKHGSYDDLKAHHRLININRLPRIRGTQVDSQTSFLWIEGFDILNNVHKWMPFEVVHTNYTKPYITGNPHFVMTSNGLASGNHIMEATVHAINELIERDATTLWSLQNDSAKMQTLLDLETVTNLDARHLLNQLKNAGIDVFVWHQPTDIGLPTFRCELYEWEQNPFHKRVPFVGFGTHLTKNIALTRAITEAVQSRLIYIAGVRDDLDLQLYDLPDLNEQIAARRQQLMDVVPVVDFATLANYPHETFNADLQHQLKSLQAAGIDEVVAVDLTRHEYDIPVVRIVIPGLEATRLIGAQYLPGERGRKMLGLEL